ncbi:pre-mRNA-splicing factor 18-like protein [Carex littledalei]|uniref:Pre-mRNA-splicing factor 18-like protein n=1 Tax=Carex littledalei TaxID=544730 RepID=A0A833QFJ9_9POAL|nr:pre-mRNA-splicing factor 18-like protein [Carex littledalei]
MDLLKQELQRKRRFLESEFSGRKALRQSEIHHLEIQKLREKMFQQAQSKKSTSPTPTPTPSPPQPNSNTHTQSAKEDPTLPRDEVIRRLRILKQPVTLFGEDDIARFKRLQSVIESGALEIDAEEIGDGQTNDFLRDIYELRKRQKAAIRNSGEGANEEMNKEVPFEDLCDEDKIKVFFKRLLDEWGKEVEEMPETERRTAKGKSVVATYKQCARYLDPLFKMCKKKALPDDVRGALLNVVNCCVRRDYLSAMDHYIRLAIGNSPWPIGVTMVGIHERSAREKICTSSVAHIMNDETTRKYLQSVKRLMTFCQRKYPTNPSRSVEFNSLANGSDLQSLLAEQSRMKEGREERLRLVEAV